MKGFGKMTKLIQTLRESYSTLHDKISEWRDPAGFRQKEIAIQEKSELDNLLLNLYTPEGRDKALKMYESRRSPNTSNQEGNISNSRLDIAIKNMDTAVSKMKYSEFALSKKCANLEEAYTDMLKYLESEGRFSECAKICIEPESPLKERIGIYKRISELVEKTQRSPINEPIKHKKTELYDLVNQLSTEKAKELAAGMALNKGLIDGTELEFQPYLKHYLSIADLSHGIELMRHVQGNLAATFYNPFSDMYFDSKLNETDREQHYKGAIEAWEEAGQFTIVRLLANRKGDKERYNLYNNLARLLEGSGKYIEEDKKPDRVSINDIFGQVQERNKTLSEKILTGIGYTALSGLLLLGGLVVYIEYKNDRYICNKIAEIKPEDIPQNGLEVKIKDLVGIERTITILDRKKYLYHHSSRNKDEIELC